MQEENGHAGHRAVNGSHGDTPEQQGRGEERGQGNTDRLASKLELQMLADLRAETVAIKKLINERNGQHADSTKQIVELLHKFKAIAGIEEKNVLDVREEKHPEVAGQRERTCPKTRQPLVHLSLAPNYALKNLILQWCDKHKVELQRREPEPVAEQDGHPREDIPSLVEALSSIHPDVQRKAAKKIRMLSKESPENRALIVGNGGILL
ncbi:hypothetical protein ZWY2020_028817 [Hordeum vulgare]|nr:hypothetical protein ZWY2020_028817 [Hordeum vulgare]